MRRRSAPVKDPFSWPNSSLSRSVSGRAAQLTAFAADEHGHILLRDAADRLEDFQHFDAAADKQVAGPLGRVGSRERDRDVHHPPRLNGLLHQLAQRGQLQGLGDVVVRAELHGFNGRFAPRSGRDEDHRQPPVDLLDALKDAEAGLAGQDDIEQYDVGADLADFLQPLLGRARGVHSVPGVAQRLLGQMQHRTVIVNNENIAHVARLQWRVEPTRYD
jgi:hypothetical protein